ncbi:hypothetical protein LX83_006675 [Goodfellowiella coeruleoviolacea]|uniref:DNA primase/polymerase bifunctional N-terminal domain-containing protein n=1 Tax=Goodfellowiella coeruleoviolacea TaxID=334858 RepID=A0AAE3KKW4_9PSEU|nr:hypothetical protein [Goodfellowiella coeruleoviolacea]
MRHSHAASLDAATRYVANGWPILPGTVHPDAVRPWLPHSVPLRTVEQVRRWWVGGTSSVWLFPGPLFSLLSVEPALARELFESPEFQRHPGPVLHEQGRDAQVVFVVSPVPERFEFPPSLRSSVRLVPSWDSVPAPPTIKGGYEVYWWYHPDRVGWQPAPFGPVLAAVTAVRSTWRAVT